MYGQFRDARKHKMSNSTCKTVLCDSQVLSPPPPLVRFLMACSLQADVWHASLTYHFLTDNGKNGLKISQYHWDSNVLNEYISQFVHLISCLVYYAILFVLLKAHRASRPARLYLNLRRTWYPVVPYGWACGQQEWFLSQLLTLDSSVFAN